MSYIPNKNIMIINVPKNGTRTLDKMIRETGNDPNLVNGHKTMSQAMKSLTMHKHTDRPDFISNIRNPHERFLSGLNHVYAQNPNVDLDKAIDLAMSGDRHIVFIEQHKFFDIKEKIKLFPFWNMQKIAKYIGFNGEIPHLGSSIKRWKATDIIKHKRIEEIEQKYKIDIDLYSKMRMDYEKGLDFVEIYGKIG